MIDIKLKGFTPVIDGLVDEYGLITAAVYGIVYRYCQMEKGYCNASLEKMGSRLDINSKTIKRHLTTLCEEGYIEDLTPDVRNEPHRYIVTGKIKIEGDINTNGSENWSDTESDQTPDGGTQSPTGWDTESYLGRTESPLKKDSKKDSKKQHGPNGTNGQKKYSDAALAQLQSFGVIVDEDEQRDLTYDTEQEIQNTGWEIYDSLTQQVIAMYIQSVRRYRPAFAIPNSTSRRKDWVKTVSEHLQDYPFESLQKVYDLTIDKLLEKELSYSRPGALTKTMAEIDYIEPEPSEVWIA